MIKALVQGYHVLGVGRRSGLITKPRMKRTRFIRGLLSADKLWPGIPGNSKNYGNRLERATVETGGLLAVNLEALAGCFDYEYPAYVVHFHGDRPVELLLPLH